MDNPRGQEEKGMEANILCERNEYEVLTGFFEELSVLLKDSDDAEEKERIQAGLGKLRDTSSYMIVGEEDTGKTSLLRMIFEDIFTADDDMAGDICEYRWGEQDFQTPVMDGVQKKFMPSDNMRGITIVDTKGISRMGAASSAKLREMAAGSDALFAVLGLDNIRSPRLWDMMERMPGKQMVVFLTKCDAATTEDLNANLEKIRNYMREADISAPVFPVGITKDIQCPGVVEPAMVRAFIRKNIIGENPMLKKQYGNIMELKQMLVQFRESFARRKEQYEADAIIVQRIDTALDRCVLNHRQTIQRFTERLAEDIGKKFEEYEKEVISALDISGERGELRKDEEKFTDNLERIGGEFQKKTEEFVNGETEKVLKKCIGDLQIAYQAAVGYFNERENILALNDRFYGTIGESKARIAEETKEAAMMAGEFYETLQETQGERFGQIWNEWRKYDNRIFARKAVCTVVGAGGGAAAGTVGAGVLTAFVKGGIESAGKMVSAKGVGEFFKEAASLTATTVGIPAFVGIAGIGLIVGGFAVNALGKKFYDTRIADRREQNISEYIRQFRDEAAQNRNVITEQVSGQVIEMFEDEFAKIDACFTEFRISVNVEGGKLPMLQQKLETVGVLEERIRKIEGA